MNVSSECLYDGPMHTIIDVQEFPPNESYSNQVSFESQNGVCFTPFSVNELIQFPRQEREKLIFLASSSRSSLAPVFFTRSLPAKSTRNKVL